MRLQRTIERPVAVRGWSMISGLDVVVRFHPAPENSGIYFVRTDLPAQPIVPASIDCRVEVQRRTALERDGVRVEMTEHILAALRGLGIDNCRVDITGPETPGCDGSALQFARALLDAGTQVQSAWTEPIRVSHPICVSDGRAFIAALPNPHGYAHVDYTLDYRGASSWIGRQRFECQLTVVNFLAELAPARTFLLESEAAQLRQIGWGKKTTARDLLIYGTDGPMENAERYTDEPARHKALDIVGDLALMGRDWVAAVVAYRSGHRLNSLLARAILAAAARQEPDEAIAAGVPIWPGVLSALPRGRFRLDGMGTECREIGLGATLLAAWVAMAKASGRDGQLSQLDFDTVHIEDIPEPQRPFKVEVTPQRTSQASVARVVQDGRVYGELVARVASTLAQAA